jgi:hypothetical protein
MALSYVQGGLGDIPGANGFTSVGLFASTIAAGSAYGNSTTPTNVEGAFVGPITGSPAGTFPAAFLNTVGKVFRVRASGIIADTATPNLTVAVLLGTTVIATTAAQALVAITGTAQWTLDVTCTVTGAGASGSVLSFGKFDYNTTSAILVATWRCANSTVGTATTPVDLTVAQALHVQATWGTQSASNTLTCGSVTVELLN